MISIYHIGPLNITIFNFSCPPIIFTLLLSPFCFCRNCHFLCTLQLNIMYRKASWLNKESLFLKESRQLTFRFSKCHIQCPVQTWISVINLNFRQKKIQNGSPRRMLKGERVLPLYLVEFHFITDPLTPYPPRPERPWLENMNP